MTRDPVVAARRRLAIGRSVRHLLRACALIAALAACGSDDDEGGGAGSAPMVTPGLGEPCIDECTSGLVCSPAGLFPRQCSAQCSGIGSCAMLATNVNSACFGNGANQCCRRCSSDGECPTGTKCRPVAGQMGCVVAP